VMTDRRWANSEFGRNLFIGEASGDSTDDLNLARGEMVADCAHSFFRLQEGPNE